MYRMCSLAALLVALVGVGAHAAPRPEDKSIGPSIVGQAKSIDDLLKATKAMVRAIGGEQLANIFEKEAMPNLDPKKIPGIDPKRPFAVYGTVDVELSKCRGVIMAPVTSEKAFLDMLEMFGIKSEKENGIFKIETPPDFPIPVYLKVHKNYAYIALGGADALDPKAIYDPNEVINEKEPSLVYLGLRLDRVPKETKKLALANLRDLSDQGKEAATEPELKDVLTSLDKFYMRWLRILFDEAKEVAIRFDANPKTGELALEVTVEPLPKSTLADTIRKREATKNVFAGLSGPDDVQRLYLTAPLFAEEIQDVFAKLLDLGKRKALEESQGEPAEITKLIEASFSTLKATVQAGDMDLGITFRGPTKAGHYNVLGAIQLKDAQTLEKAIKDAIKIIPGPEKNWFKLDAGKIGDLSVHQIDFNSEADEMIKKLFGEKGSIVYLAFGKDAIYATFGPDGMKLLKEVIEAKPKAAASFESWADGKKSAELLRKIVAAEQGGKIPDELESMLSAMKLIENAAGMSIKIDGGDKLRFRVTYGAASLGWLFMGFNGRAIGPGAAPPAKE